MDDITYAFVNESLHPSSRNYHPWMKILPENLVKKYDLMTSFVEGIFVSKEECLELINFIDNFKDDKIKLKWYDPKDYEDFKDCVINDKPMK